MTARIVGRHSAGTPRLSGRQRCAILGATAIRVAGTPLVAVFGLLTTAITVAHTGSAVFGVVTLISTVALLLPFVDLGIGSVAGSVCARPGPLAADPVVRATIRRAFGVLGLVAAGMIATVLGVSAADGWGRLIGVVTSPADRWAIAVALGLFALSVPAGLGPRILLGIDRNQLAVAVLLLNSIVVLMITEVLAIAGVRGIWYAIPGPAGALAGNLVATALALRLTGLTPRVLGTAGPVPHERRLPAGSPWRFLIGVGLPLGLQSQLLLLAHGSTPEELSRYALGAQLYALAWSICAAAGPMLVPGFARRRPDAAASLALWERSVGGFGGAGLVCALGLFAAGPFAADLLSGGRITVPVQLIAAFGVLLLVRCVHLPSDLLLTTPNEMRWQAWCALNMAGMGLLGGYLLAPDYGAVGVVLAAAGAVLVTQVLPDFACVPEMVRGRLGLVQAGRHRLGRAGSATIEPARKYFRLPADTK